MKNLVAILILFSTLPSWAGKVIPPPPPTFVLDEPKILSTTEVTTLHKILGDYQVRTKHQIVVAIFNSLDGEDPETFANQVFRAWKIGQVKINDGILLTVFWQERKIRIDVGYGLEGVITDYKSKEILATIVKPNLKNKHPAAAIEGAVNQIISLIDASETMAPPVLTSPPAQNSSENFWFILGLVIFIVLVVGRMFYQPKRVQEKIKDPFPPQNPNWLTEIAPASTVTKKSSKNNKSLVKQVPQSKRKTSSDDEESTRRNSFTSSRDEDEDSSASSSSSSDDSGNSGDFSGGGGDSGGGGAGDSF